MDQIPTRRLHLIGDSNTGKTALLDHLLTKRFSPVYQPSSSVTPTAWSLHIAGKEHQVLIHDTPGRYEPQVDPAGVIIVLFSFTSVGSLEWAMGLVRKLQAAGQGKMLLVATKADEANAGISPIQGSKYAHSLGVSFLETSAKTGLNVETCFQTAARMLIPAVQDFSIEEIKQALSAVEEGNGFETDHYGGAESPPFAVSPDSPNSWDNEMMEDDPFLEEIPSEGTLHYHMLYEDVEKCEMSTQTENPKKRRTKVCSTRRKPEDMDKYWLRQFRKYMKKAYFNMKSRMEISERSYWKKYLSVEMKPDKGREFKSYNSDYRSTLFSSAFFRERFGRWFSAEAKAVLGLRFDPGTSNYESFLEYGETELLKLCNSQESEDFVLTYFA